MVFRYKLLGVSTFHLFSDLKRMLRYWIRDKKQEFAAEGESSIWSVLGEKTIYVYSRDMWSDVILLLNV